MFLTTTPQNKSRHTNTQTQPSPRNFCGMTKVNRTLNLLRCTLHGCSKIKKIKVYNSLVRPHQKSSCVVWIPHQRQLQQTLVIRSPLGPCSLAGIARWLQLRKQPRLKNDLTSNLMTSFAILVSRIMQDNELFCSLFKCNPILFAKPHPKRYIRL